MAIYYVKTSGNDANSGLSDAQAWKTLAKVAAIAPGLAAGDKVLFRSGDVWKNEALTLSSVTGAMGNEVVFGSYESGAKPEFSGAIAVTGWTVHTGNVYVATVSGYYSNTDMVGVLKNGVLMKKGRYPSADFLTNDVVIDFFSRNQIKDAELPTLFANNYWNGAEVVMRTRVFMLDKVIVSSHTGDTINLATNPTYGIQAGNGYFFQNSLKTLTEALPDYKGEPQARTDGDWYWDKANKKLYMYSSSGAPSNVEACYTNSLVTISADCSDLIFENIAISKAKTTNLTINANKHVTVRYCDVKQGGTNGVKFSSALLVNFHSNNLEWIQNNALDGSVTYASVHRNNFTNCATVAGMGLSSSGQYMTFKLSGGGLIEYNTLDQVGYNGIHYGGSPWTVQKNKVLNFNTTLADGGGIYTFDNIASVSNIIYRNIVGYGKGSFLKGGSDGFSDNGLYSDGGASGNRFRKNFVFKCAQGILNHIGSNEVFRNNLIVGSYKIGIRMGYDLGGTGNPASRNNDIQHNTIVAGNEMMPNISIFSETPADLNLLGSINNNKHVVPMAYSNVKSPVMIEKDAYNQVAEYYGVPVASTVYGMDDSLSIVHRQRFSIATSQSDQVVNGSMDSSPNNNSGFGNTNGSSATFLVTKIPGTDPNAITGNTFQFKFNGPAVGDIGRVVHKSLTITKGKYYRFRFDVKATEESSFTFRIQDGNSEYGRPIHATTSLQSYDFVFKAEFSIDRILLDFLATHTGNISWFFDNAKFQEVTIIEDNYDDYVKLEYNDTDAVKTVNSPGPGTWVDVDGNAITFPVLLNEFADAIVMIKTD